MVDEITMWQVDDDWESEIKWLEYVMMTFKIFDALQVLIMISTDTITYVGNFETKKCVDRWADTKFWVVTKLYLCCELIYFVCGSTTQEIYMDKKIVKTDITYSLSFHTVGWNQSGFWIGPFIIQI